MQARVKFPHVHTITGTIVLLVVGGLITVLLFAGRSQRWFLGNVPLQIVLPEDGAAGIRQGSEVYFLGTLMGTVSDVSVDSSGRMVAQVNIRRDFFQFMRIESSAVVKRKFGVVGDAYFEITRGQGPVLPEKNARIICNEQLPSALESAVEEIRIEAVPALKRLNAGLATWTVLGSNLITSQDRLDQILLRVNEMANGIQQGKGTFGKLLTDPAAAEEWTNLLGKASGSLNEMQAILNHLKEASGNLQLASTNLPAIGEALGKEARDLPGLVLQTQMSMRELERLLEAMQRHWLLRKYVNPTNPPSLRPMAPFELPKRAPVRRTVRSPRDSTR